MNFSTTAINAGLVCLKKFEYQEILKLRRKPSEIKPAMRLGTWVHHALQHYPQGNDWLASLDPLMEWADQNDVDYAEILEETKTIMEGYVWYWERQNEKPWKTITSEEPIFINVGQHSIRATVDSVVEDRGELWLVEHKTTTRIPDQNWRSIDPQTALQWIVCHASGKYPVVGIIFNYLLTVPPSKPQILKSGKGFYARDIKTTTLAFDKAARELGDCWPLDQREEFSGYIEQKRSEMVQNGAFFQRYRVRKPEAVIRGTIQDVAAMVRAVEEAQRTDYWRRSQSLVTCPNFCTYQKLCAQEFMLGHPAEAMRKMEFVVETPDLRAEGRF